MKKLICPGFNNDYPLFISQDGTFKDFYTKIPESQKKFVIYDKNIEKYFPEFLDGFEDEGLYKIPVTAVEENKSFKKLEQVIADIIKEKPSRDDIIIVIGGGLVLNLGGLVASLTMRGMKFIYVPTTLTAQIDAGIGSKMAVNFHGAKNWIGMYNDPIFSYINPSFLYKVDERELKSQWIEGIKLSLVVDKDLFYKVYNDLETFYDNKKEQLNKYMDDMLEMKIKILKTDLLEKKEGASMIYGHTLGHAIEMKSEGLYNHGEAVGLGMVCAAKISKELGLIDQKTVDLHEDILKRLKLPSKISKNINPEDVIEHTIFNKTNIKGNVPFCLIEGIGKHHMVENEYYRIIPKETIKKVVFDSY